MHDFAADDAESLGERASGNYGVPDVAPFARIILSSEGDSVVCSVEVARDLNVEIADMFFGPFNLLPNAV